MCADPACAGIPTSKQAVAQQLVELYNQKKLSVGPYTGIWSRQILPIAQNRVEAGCDVDLRALQSVLIITKKFGQVTLSDLNRNCLEHSDNCKKYPSANHCPSPTHGVDINGYSGRLISGASQTVPLLQFIAQFAPTEANGVWAEKNCDGNGYGDVIRRFDGPNDCNHQHIDFRDHNRPLNISAGPVGPSLPVANGVSPLILPSNQIALYTIRGDGNLWGTAQQSAGGVFGGWQLIGGQIGTIVGRPAVARTSAGLIVAYARTTAGTIVGTGQSMPGGTFAPWRPIGLNGGGIASDPAVIILTSGLIVLYATTGSGGASGVGQTAVGRDFGSWQQIGAATILGLRPAPAQTADGRLVIYSRGSDGRIYGSGQSVAGSTFSPWGAVGTSGNSGMQSEPTVTISADQRIGLYAVAGGTLRGLTQPAGGRPFGGWVNYGYGAKAFGSTPALVPLSNGTNAIYVAATDKTGWGTVLAPGQPTSAGWPNIGNTALAATALTAKQTLTGQLVVYANAADGTVIGSGQSIAGGTFSNWAAIG